MAGNANPSQVNHRLISFQGRPINRSFIWIPANGHLRSDLTGFWADDWRDLPAFLLKAGDNRRTDKTRRTRYGQSFHFLLPKCTSTFFFIERAMRLRSRSTSRTVTLTFW